MTKFKINDVIVNRHTLKKAMIVDVQHDWFRPVYVAEYQDEIGGSFRFNTSYEKHWELVK